MAYRSIASTLALVMCATVASAQQGAQAEVMFRRGVKLLDEGKVAEACAAFDASEKLEATISTLLHQANCREKNKQLATAWGLFLDAARQTQSATDDAGKQLHQIATDHAAKLENRVSTLTINVPAGNRVKGLVVKRGDDAIDEPVWGQPLPLDGGSYTIKASAPGVSPWSLTVTLADEKDAKTVEVPKLDKVASKPVDTPKQPEPKPEQHPASKNVPDLWYCTESHYAKSGTCVAQRDRCESFRTSSKYHDFSDCTASSVARCFDVGGEAHCAPSQDVCEALQAIAKQRGNATECETRYSTGTPPPPPQPATPPWSCTESRTQFVGICKPAKDACEQFRASMRAKVSDLPECSDLEVAQCFDLGKDAHCAPSNEICESMRSAAAKSASPSDCDARRRK